MAIIFDEQQDQEILVENIPATLRELFDDIASMAQGWWCINFDEGCKTLNQCDRITCTKCGTYFSPNSKPFFRFSDYLP